MKRLKNLGLALVFIAGMQISACHNKSHNEASKTSADTTSTTTAPVQIESDATLKDGVRDATKDYPGVNASVDNGEITLTGEITRDKLSKLMQSLNALHPKKSTII